MGPGGQAQRPPRRQRAQRPQRRSLFPRLPNGLSIGSRRRARRHPREREPPQALAGEAGWPRRIQSGVSALDLRGQNLCCRRPDLRRLSAQPAGADAHGAALARRSEETRIPGAMGPGKGLHPTASHRERQQHSACARRPAALRQHHLRDRPHLALRRTQPRTERLVRAAHADSVRQDRGRRGLAHPPQRNPQLDASAHDRAQPGRLRAQLPQGRRHRTRSQIRRAPDSQGAAPGRRRIVPAGF